MLQSMIVGGNRSRADLGPLPPVTSFAPAAIESATTLSISSRWRARAERPHLGRHLQRRADLHRFRLALKDVENSSLTEASMISREPATQL